MNRVYEYERLCEEKLLKYLFKEKPMTIETAKYNPEIINPCDLVDRIRKKLNPLILEAIDRGEFVTASAYVKAIDIMIDELQAMLNEATAEILAKSKKGGC